MFYGRHTFTLYFNELSSVLDLKNLVNSSFQIYYEDILIGFRRV